MAKFKRTADNPRKTDSVKKDQKPRKKKQRRKFLEVDVWQTQFGIVSEKAVYDVFQQKFNIESHNMRKYSFQHCVNSLRKLEKPDYIAPTYGTGRN